LIHISFSTIPAAGVYIPNQYGQLRLLKSRKKVTGLRNFIIQIHIVEKADVRIRVARVQSTCIAQVQFGLQGLSGKIDSVSEAHCMSIYFISGF
jgi:hypothetical protein